MTALDNPCYLCRKRTLGCHSKCQEYTTFAQYRQQVAAKRHRIATEKSYYRDHKRMCK